MRTDDLLAARRKEMLGAITPMRSDALSDRATNVVRENVLRVR
jgi:hypothetical protein